MATSRTGIAKASDQEKITLSKDQALKVFGDVKASLGFDVKPGPNPPAGLIKKPGNTTIYSYTDNKGETYFTDDLDSIPKANRKNMKIISQAALNKALGSIGGGSSQAPGPQYTAKPNPEAINQQYEEQGPPVVTYYVPPDSLLLPLLLGSLPVLVHGILLSGLLCFERFPPACGC